jgi:hypothetical protein
MVEGRGILTIADMPGFVEGGGMFSLCIENAKIRFDVNSLAIADGGLKVSSQLLRLARNVIRKDGDGAGEKR